MKNIKDLQQMIKEPASKEWFEKHGDKKRGMAKKMIKSPVVKEGLNK